METVGTMGQGTDEGQKKRPRRILGNFPKRKLRKETCNKQTYRNRKWDMRNTGSWNSRWKKNKGEFMKNVTSHEYKETNMKNEVAEIGNSEKSEV